jgi:hypothetical protein
VIIQYAGAAESIPDRKQPIAVKYRTGKCTTTLIYSNNAKNGLKKDKNKIVICATVSFRTILFEW